MSLTAPTRASAPASAAAPEAAAANRADGSRTALSVREVTVHLGGKTVLSDISFQAKQGEFLGILGPNGAGKTTLFRVLLRQLKPQSGRVEWLADGQPGRPAVGYVPQARQIDPELPLRAWDFVALGLPHTLRPWLNRADREAVYEAMERTGSARLAASPIGRLSGGERQRVFLAQALVRRPRMLLLDEPTSNLDPGAQEAAAEIVHSVCRSQGIGVLLISHDVNLVSRYADRILYLTPGHYAVGTVDEVMRPSVLRRLYGSAVDVVRLDGKLMVTVSNRPDSQVCYH